MIGWIIGHFWWWILPVRKKESIERFGACFPDLSPTLLRKGVGVFVGQYLRLAFRLRLRCPKLPEGGAIVLAGHGGAWDMALITIAEKQPISIFLKEPSNRLLAAIIDRWRRKAGITALHGRNILNESIRAVDKEQWLVFVQDQRLNDGLESSFFGRGAKTSAGFAAAVLKRPNAPIYGIWQDGKTIEIEELKLDIPKDKKTAIDSLTLASQDYYARKIKSKPAQWLWLHRRWKH